MHTPELFADLLIILLVSVPVAFLCLRVKLPVIVGLMVTGMAIGPYGLGLIKDLHSIELLAEIGVTLLLFTIGLEFSVKRLREMKTLVLVGGGLQVLLTIAATVAVGYFFGREIRQGVFFGFLIALSSTAIVLKTYVERNEVDAPHGRAGVGILLFQDISIVFMLLAIPLLGGEDIVSFASIVISLATSLFALVVIVVAAWLLLPLFLKQVVMLRSPEVFVLTVVLFCLGMSFVTSHFGLSLALGGFIAGMVLADSDYNHQVTTEVLPFRDVFNALFFVSIGLLLSLTALIANIGSVGLIVIGMMLTKALIIWLIIRLLGFPQRIAIMTAMGLAQIGEFSFVLAKVGQSVNLLPENDYQIFLASSIISMIATPFMIAAAPKVSFWLQKFLRDGTVHDVENAESDEVHMTSSGGLQQHVIIVGYGLNGKNLARVLRAVSIPYVVLELDAEVVKRAKGKGEKINFGDATRREVLAHVNIDQAWAVVLAMSDPQAARRTVDQIRKLNDRVHIIVRTRYVAEISELYALGADEVIPEEFETSIEIFSRVLYRYGIARSVIENQIDRIRKQGYEMLRSPSGPAGPVEDLRSALNAAGAETINLPSDSPAIGKNLAQLDLRGQTGATLIAVVRNGETIVSPGADFRMQAADTTVLLGPPESIERAVEFLCPNQNAFESTLRGFNP